jgi:hypothetical protein
MPRRLPWATMDSPVVKERKRTQALRKLEASTSDDEECDVRKSKALVRAKGAKKRANCMKTFSTMDFTLTNAHSSNALYLPSAWSTR